MAVLIASYVFSSRVTVRAVLCETSGEKVIVLHIKVVVLLFCEISVTEN